MNASALCVTAAASSSSVSLRGIGRASVGGLVPAEVSRLHLWGHPAPGWSFRYPMPVAVERDTTGRFVASDDLFANYGTGDTAAEAIADLKGSLVEFYRLLSSSGDARSRNIFSHLRTYLAHTPR